MGTEKLDIIYINDKYGIEHSLLIPYEDSLEELAHILILKYNLPIYVEKELTHHLKDFIEEQTKEYYEELTTTFINKARKKELDLEEITKEWEKTMKEEMVEFGEKRCASDEELFATAYHKLVHSPALETMLQFEHVYAKAVRQKTEEKNQQIKKLSDRQSEEMNKALDRLEQDMTESEINDLVARHYETHSFLQGQLTSELDTMKEAQRRKYREWIMQMLEQNQANSSLPTPSSPVDPVPIKDLPTTICNNLSRDSVNSPILEESFTIHLGSQLKQMHNIRILSANVMDLCSIEDNEEMSEPTPQILQTALGLYSNDLTGLVLMTDNKIGSRLSQDFQEMCQNTTEFHFPHIEEQLNKISNVANKYLKNLPADSTRNVNSELLQPGDFYITRHSNLAQVHVIFHMVTDDSLRGNDINSRHPVVLGLRHILKTACSNDVTSLTIPLLLQYDMTDEMTTIWCEKRAELVFKCVKGFMIEMASWGGSELKNLQFMLPEGISHAVFTSMTEMLPRIFKVCNPKILK
ncbi:protein C12orf4 homolog [Anthonomus grandis grandis]|uniref:protein C12orf4 homolog n=1 Tax=Anthonomus grandis grandis TaxID=2921223 RepID=UPI00216563BC|nr:protein C12orf4 homolog [Anthonomus grandis grandis]